MKIQWEGASTYVYNIGYILYGQQKYRRKILINRVDKYLKKLLLEIAEENGFVIENMEVMPDHCHVFVKAHPKYASSKIIKMLKGVSARKLFQEFIVLKEQLRKGHLWNPSYYVGTAGSMTKVQRSINEQKLR